MSYRSYERPRYGIRSKNDRPSKQTFSTRDFDVRLAYGVESWMRRNRKQAKPIVDALIAEHDKTLPRTLPVNREWVTETEVKGDRLAIVTGDNGRGGCLSQVTFDDEED